MPPCKLCQSQSKQLPSPTQSRCAWDGPFVQNKRCGTLERLWDGLLEGADKDHPHIRVCQTHMQAPPSVGGRVQIGGGALPVFRYAIVDVSGVRAQPAANWQDAHLLVMGRLYGPKGASPYVPESQVTALVVGAGAVWAPSEAECITLMGYLSRTYREATP